MFVVGDKVRCINSRGANGWAIINGHLHTTVGNHLPGLAYRKKMTVTQTREFSDGSQQIWVKYRTLDTPVGPYLSTRFEMLTKGYTTYEYNPNQQGDTDEDI